jgi:hypothetical protein
MPNTRGSRAGSGTNNGPDDLVRVLRDEQIIELRRDGMTLRQIASSVGVALSTVQAAIRRWLDERGPPFAGNLCGPARAAQVRMRFPQLGFFEWLRAASFPSSRPLPLHAKAHLGRECLLA